MTITRPTDVLTHFARCGRAGVPAWPIGRDLTDMEREYWCQAELKGWIACDAWLGWHLTPRGRYAALVYGVAA